MNKTSYYLSVLRSERLIRWYFSRRSHDRDEVADLCQEALAELLDAYDRFRGDCRFETWAYSVCRNVFRKHVYYQVRKRKIDRMLTDQCAIEKPAEAGVGGGTDEYGPDALLDLNSALASLDIADRRLYRLYYLERRSVAEVASLLGRSAGTVKWLLYRLRGRIAELILRGGTDRVAQPPTGRRGTDLDA